MTPNSRRSRLTVEGAERRARIVEQRRSRVPFEDIGEALGISAQRAYEIYREAIAAIPAQQVEEHRAEEVDLADHAVRRLVGIAESSKSDRTRVEAWSAIRQWSERKARLLGLDQPVRVDATVTELDARDAELAQMIAEAKAEIAAERGLAE